MIKPYISHADTVITDCYDAFNVTRMTGSNAGALDILEVFGLYQRQAISSSEEARILINFPIGQIDADRSASVIPASGAVSFFLEMYNCPHGQTLPRNFTLEVLPLGQSWVEGNGMAGPGEIVLGSPVSSFTYDDPAAGANWLKSRGDTNWASPGGSTVETFDAYTYRFESGTEDLVNLDITELVEKWVANDLPRNGVLIKLTGSQAPESGSFNSTGSTSNYFTKKFFGRDSEFWFKKPKISARWDSSIRDDRGRFWTSSSVLSNDDNLGRLYLYNWVKGQLRDIESVGSGPFVSIYDDATSSIKLDTNPSTVITASKASTGVYYAEFAIANTGSDLAAIWHNAAETVTYLTQDFRLEQTDRYASNPNPQYLTALLGGKSEYRSDETARFRFFVKEKNRPYNLYVTAQTENPSLSVNSASFEIYRVIDDEKVIPFDTGSTLSTRLSYDVSGNYFDLPMNLLQPDYMYGVRIAYYNGAQSSYVVQPETFRFRVA